MMLTNHAKEQLRRDYQVSKIVETLKEWRRNPNPKLLTSARKAFDLLEHEEYLERLRIRDAHNETEPEPEEEP